MNSGKILLSNIDRVQQLGQILKSMNVDIDRKETAMAILQELSFQLENIITTLHASRDDSSVFTLDILKSQLLQEEQQSVLRYINESEPVLFSSNRCTVSPARTYYCNYYKRRGHAEDCCWNESPSLTTSSTIILRLVESHKHYFLIPIKIKARTIKKLLACFSNFH